MQNNFKQATAHFITGVCVVLYNNPQSNKTDGITISAFSSLSLEPLKILFCLNNTNSSKDKFNHVNKFSVNILSNKQKELAYQFAGQDRSNLTAIINNDKDGIPILKKSLATLICDKGNTYIEGDHSIIIGNVTNISLADNTVKPLLYYKSEIIEDYQNV